MKIFPKNIPALIGAIGAVFLAQNDTSAEEIKIGLGGNAYVVSAPAGAQINDTGVVNWKNPDAKISAFFFLEKPQNAVKMALLARGHGKISVVVNDTVRAISISEDNFSSVPLGEFSFAKSGYQRVDFFGLEKENDTFADLAEIALDGVEGGVFFVQKQSNYFGRRGPSTHLFYPLPNGTDVEYFYNEVTVPPGEDVIGAYFATCGFDGGYFGIQVNSPEERRVLFSVWSPFQTDDPKKIPEEMRVKNLRRGEGVHIGEFGNEGSGGQSFLRYRWRAGVTYKTLVRARPNGTGATEFTAYFFAPEKNEWQLIASFLRPKTDSWLRGAYSFSENFLPAAGHTTRRAEFGNQWIRDKNGTWMELTKAQLSRDEIGQKKMRLDYAGGVTPDGKKFFLKNCGFFSETTPVPLLLERKPSGEKPPQADLEKLGN